MLLDFFLQVLKLALDLVEETAVRAANRLVVGLVQPVLRSGFFFLEGLAGARKLLKPARRRLKRFPGPRLPPAEACDQGGIGRIGFRAL